MKTSFYLTLLFAAFLFSSCQNKQINLSEDSMVNVLQKIEAAKVEQANEIKNTATNDSVWKIAPYTAKLENAIEYLRANNKYKDWDAKDKKRVVLEGIVEKDSTLTNLKIRRACGVKELDEEALRLIKNKKISPGKDDNLNIIRSEWAIVIPFPAQ